MSAVAVRIVEGRIVRFGDVGVWGGTVVRVEADVAGRLVEQGDAELVEAKRPSVAPRRARRKGGRSGAAA
jgi:hypothetical protein